MGKLEEVNLSTAKAYDIGYEDAMKWVIAKLLRGHNAITIQREIETHLENRPKAIDG